MSYTAVHRSYPVDRSSDRPPSGDAYASAGPVCGFGNIFWKIEASSLSAGEGIDILFRWASFATDGLTVCIARSSVGRRIGNGTFSAISATWRIAGGTGGRGVVEAACTRGA